MENNRPAVVEHAVAGHPEARDPLGEVELARLARIEVVSDRDRHGVAHPGGEYARSVVSEPLGRLLVREVAEPPHRSGFEIVDPTARAVLGVVGNEQSVAVGAPIGGRGFRTGLADL